MDSGSVYDAPFSLSLQGPKGETAAHMDAPDQILGKPQPYVCSERVSISVYVLTRKRYHSRLQACEDVCRGEQLEEEALKALGPR